jgi:putative ABC transport system permease protein
LLLESFRQDTRIGFRILNKEKSFCFLAVTVLALGICGVTTQFTVVNATVLRGFSFPHPEQLVNVGLIDPLASDRENNNGAGTVPSSQDYEDIRAATQSFSAMAAYFGGGTITLSYRNNPQRYTGSYVTEDFFGLLGVAPILGRDFKAEDNKPGAERVAILSDEIWRRDFNGDPGIVGQNVRLNGRSATIIAVMPKNFKFPVNEQLWVPMYNEFPVTPRGTLNTGSPQVMGRLKPNVNLDQVNAEMIGIAHRMALANPKTNSQFVSARVEPLLNTMIGPNIRQTVYAMLAAVVVVLLIACVNVMNMQFGRVVLRAKELAIRGALGATRGRLVRQMLTESLLVAALGAIAGVTIAYQAVELLVRATGSLPFPLPYWIVFKIDARVLAFTVGITLFATLLSGFVPAWLSARANACDVMKEGGRGNSSRLTNLITRILVVFQVALTAGLLVIATLQIKSIRNQSVLDYGYDEAGSFSGRMALFEAEYPPEARLQFFARVLRSLRSNPAFDGAALTDRVRMLFDNFGQFELEGHSYVTDRDRPQSNFEAISDGYFSALGLRILEGRDFTIDDTDAKQPVAIVNASFAKKWFGRESAIGKQIRIYNFTAPSPWRSIVGVVPDTLMQGPINQQADSSGFYVPLLGSPPSPFCTILVRPHSGQRAETLGPAFSRAIAQLDPNLPVYFTGTPAHLHNEVLGFNRINASLFTIFGLVATILASVGLYGVMSFSVNQRRQEFGIRMALGANAENILRMVMTQGAWQLGIGLALGAGAAALLLGVIGTSTLQNFLFHVNPLDPLIYGGVAILLTGVAAASCFIPARRATRVSPMAALRSE